MELPLPLREVPQVERLRVLTSGPLPAQVTNLLGSAEMRELLGRLSVQSDYVILDSPPVCTVSDALLVARPVGTTLLVVAAEKSQRKEAIWAKHLLENVGADFLGVLLNMARGPQGVEYYYYYYHGRKEVRTRE
jgi:capsular exopolysaccharide synthesis family protein